jgi:hypothetical protein
MINAVEVSQKLSYELEFSFCTLVTKPEEYQKMLDSLEKSGFNSLNAEFLYINNAAANVFDGFSGLRHFLSLAKGKYIFLLHQDIVFFDNIDILRNRLNELDKLDPNWAIAGNAGAREPKNYYIKVTDYKNNLFVKGDKLPAAVNSLDENLVIVKNEAQLTLSHDLNGFHFYATDLCQIAQNLGYTCYVIDFHVQHFGPGYLYNDFFESKSAFIKKYSKIRRAKFLQTTCIRLYVGAGLPGRYFWNSSVGMFLAKEFYRIYNFVKYGKR